MDDEMESFETILRLQRDGKIKITPISVRGYIEKHRDKFPWADTILEYGREFKPPSEHIAREVYKHFGKLDFPMGQCFSNSLKNGLIEVGKEIPPINYVEGFTISPPKKRLIHSWNSVNGKVVDTTWKLFSHFTDYMGIEFPPEFIREIFTHQSKKGGEKIEGWSILMYWGIYKDPVLEYLRARS